MSASENQQRAARPSAQATRESILDAAEMAFSREGFAATSVAKIARRANVTKSLIHYHFGVKENLWLEVKRRHLDAFTKLHRQSVAGIDDGAAHLETSMRTVFRFLQDNPRYVRLSAWRNLEDLRLSAPTDPDLLSQPLARIQEAQKSGRFRDDVKSSHIALAFLSVCVQWFQAPGASRRESYTDSDRKAADQEYLEDMLKILFEGVLPR